MIPLVLTWLLKLLRPRRRVCRQPEPSTFTWENKREKVQGRQREKARQRMSLAWIPTRGFSGFFYNSCSTTRNFSSINQFEPYSILLTKASRINKDDWVDAACRLTGLVSGTFTAQLLTLLAVATDNKEPLFEIHLGSRHTSIATTTTRNRARKEVEEGSLSVCYVPAAFKSTIHDRAYCLRRTRSVN